MPERNRPDQIDPASRYAGLPTVTVPLPDGGTRTMLVPRMALAPESAGRYQARAGDRLDLIARALTGDSTRWWSIADANPEADATRLEEPGRFVDLPGKGPAAEGV